jgi:hypothetical protein
MVNLPNDIVTRAESLNHSIERGKTAADALNFHFSCHADDA